MFVQICFSFNFRTFHIHSSFFDLCFQLIVNLLGRIINNTQLLKPLLDWIINCYECDENPNPVEEVLLVKKHIWNVNASLYWNTKTFSQVEVLPLVETEFYVLACCNDIWMTGRNFLSFIGKDEIVLAMKPPIILKRDMERCLNTWRSLPDLDITPSQSLNARIWSARKHHHVTLMVYQLQKNIWK